MAWFEASKEGLKALNEGKAKSFVLRELVSNAMDEEGVTWVTITLTHSGRMAVLEVEDNAPEGFHDLTHAYTLFAPTKKRKDPTKSGRFNIGEKEVLSLCRNAYVSTTSGTVKFEEDGERKRGRNRRTCGSLFHAEIPMTKAEYAECVSTFGTFLFPPSIKVTFNGQEMQVRNPIACLNTKLDTEYEDARGRYRRTRRATSIEVYEPLEGEVPTLYELGFPVVQTGDRWHYNVTQRVPLNRERDNVPASYLQDVRAEVANVMADALSSEEVSEQWVRNACADDRIEKNTALKVADKRWGDKRCVPVPGDHFSKEEAIANDYTFVHPNELSKAEWEQMRKAGAIPSAAQVFKRVICDFDLIPESQWTVGYFSLAGLAKRLAELCIEEAIVVQFIDSPAASTIADFGENVLRFNVAKFEPSWFDGPVNEKHLSLIIHEIAHKYGGHLDLSYQNAICDIGAKLALLKPEDFI